MVSSCGPGKSFKAGNKVFCRFNFIRDCFDLYSRCCRRWPGLARGLRTLTLGVLKGVKKAFSFGFTAGFGSASPPSSAFLFFLSFFDPAEGSAAAATGAALAASSAPLPLVAVLFGCSSLLSETFSTSLFALPLPFPLPRPFPFAVAAALSAFSFLICLRSAACDAWRLERSGSLPTSASVTAAGKGTGFSTRFAAACSRAVYINIYVYVLETVHVQLHTPHLGWLLKLPLNHCQRNIFWLFGLNKKLLFETLNLRFQCNTHMKKNRLTCTLAGISTGFSPTLGTPVASGFLSSKGFGFVWTLCLFLYMHLKFHLGQLILGVAVLAEKREKFPPYTFSNNLLIVLFQGFQPILKHLFGPKFCHPQILSSNSGNSLKAVPTYSVGSSSCSTRRLSTVMHACIQNTFQ